MQIERTAATQSQHSRTVRFNDRDGMLYVTPIRDSDWLLAVVLDRQEATTSLSAILTGSIIETIALVILASAFLFILITRFITRPLGQAVTVAKTVASGDLTSHIEVRSKNEVGQLLGALKDMNGSLVKIVGEVRAGTETIATASTQIASGNLDLSSRTEEQASSLEETASSLEELTATVKQNSDNARQANQLTLSGSESWYATAVADSGAWLDLVLQGTRHGLSTNSVNSRQLNTAGLGWQASLQAGLPGELSDTLILEPQLQYSYQVQAMPTAHDGAARVDFGQGSRQQVSLGLYFGNRIAGQNKGADVGDAEANKPLSWWIKPVMTQTFGTRTEMKVDVPGVQGSAVGFKPNQNGTALALHVGVSGAVSNALVVGAQAGYSAVMGGAAPGGYQAQLMMKTKW